MGLWVLWAYSRRACGLVGIVGLQGWSQRYLQHFSFDENSAFYRNLRGLNLHEYEPWLARKTIAHPAQNRHYNSDARGRHPRGCPIGVSLTRRQVSVPWGVKSITKSSRDNAQRNKNLASAVSELVRSAALVRSRCQLDGESSEAHCAFCDQP